MGELLSYSLAASLIILVLFPVLHQIINRSTYFRFNRVVILCGLVLSLVLPLIFKAELISFPADMTVFNSGDILTVNPTITESQILIDNRIEALTNASQWLPVALIVYFAGIIVLFIREIISFLRLFGIIMKCKKKKVENHTICRISDNIATPFSWGNYIFLHGSDFDNSNCIYVHEKAHTDKKHWIDILFADLFCILLWYNPFAWMTRQFMKLNHEFEADDAVIRSGIDTYDYQRLLVVKAMNNSSITVVNSFAADKRSFRKRVLAMSKRRSSKKPILIALCAIPAVAFAATALSMPVSLNFLSSISDFSFNRELSTLEKLSESIPQAYAIENDVSKTEPDTITVIPSPLKDQTALADIIRLSIKTIQPEKNTKVNVEIVVDKDGSVKDVITDSPDGTDIAAAIAKEFNGIRFEQMTYNGRPIELRFVLPLQIKKQ